MEGVILDAMEAFRAKRIDVSGGPDIISNGFSATKLEMEGIEYMSASRLKELAESPRHYEWKYILGNRADDTPAKILGKLTHWALLSPFEFLNRYIIKPEFEGKGMKERKQEWEKALPANAIVLTKDQAEKISQMITALNSHPRASKLLNNGTPEVHTFYQDHELKDENGVPFLWYGVLDLLRSGNWVVEVKTTRSARKRDFIRDYFKLGYHLQAWKYRRQVHGITGTMPNMACVAVENAAPYTVQIFELRPALFEQANYEVTLALESFRECRKSGYWHGYSQEEVPIGNRPDWMKSRFESEDEDEP